MPEMNETAVARSLTVRHRGRGKQVWIYLGKMLRMFVYQNDWKVLPMAALIAGLVGMVVRGMQFVSMEGTLMGSFALVMVCIWNGSFNSIQVICRERDVIKREHRSGMHISSYIFSHMLYQAMLCLLQTGVTLYILKIVGVKFPPQGLFSRWLIVDFGITMFLITYASDMLSLWVSCLARTTTAAMTIMPFVLIFQLVFSGGMLSLPEWSKSLSGLTISSPGLKAIVAQSDYNASPMVTIWNRLFAMWDKELSVTVTLGQAIDLLQDEQNPTVANLRSKKLSEVLESVDPGLPALFDFKDDDTVGKVIDSLAAEPDVQASREESYTVNATVGEIINTVGYDRVRNYLLYDIRDNNLSTDYENSRSNVAGYWADLILMIFVFAAFSTVTLEFIDKDKR